MPKSCALYMLRRYPGVFLQKTLLAEYISLLLRRLSAGDGCKDV